MIIDKRDVGGYYGISRDVSFDEGLVSIHFHAYLNDEIDLVFVKRYSSNEDALASIATFLRETPRATEEEKRPTDNDWRTFELQVNTSIIQLFKDALGGNLHLPDAGAGYTLGRAEESDLIFHVSRHERGEYRRFVNYELFRED